MEIFEYEPENFKAVLVGKYIFISKHDGDFPCDAIKLALNNSDARSLALSILSACDEADKRGL